MVGNCSNACPCAYEPGLPAHLLPRCQCQRHCDFMRPALSRYHPHLHQHLMLLPVQLTADGAVVPLVRCVSIWCSSESLYVSVRAPARAPSACFFLLSPVLSVWVNALLAASSARFTPRLPVAATPPLLECVYVTLVSNSLPRGLRYRHDTVSGRRPAVRRVAQAIWS